MWLPMFVCSFLLGGAFADFSDSIANSSVKFHKCCPKGHNLKREIDMYLTEKYECVNSELTERNFSVLVPPLVIGQNLTIHYGLPEECAELVMTEVNDKIAMSNGNCYDRLALTTINSTLKRNNPIIVSIACATKEKHTSASYKINHIRKCCPGGQSYETQYHMCRDTDGVNSEQWLVQQFDPSGNSVYAVDHGLHCKADEYAVEMTEGMFTLSVEGSILMVTKIGEESARGTLLQGEWCVDQQHGAGGSRLMARGCTQDCSTFNAFCLRKCCPVGSHFLPKRCGSDVSVCVPNADDTTPYNLSYYLDPLKRDPEFSDDVLGLRISLRCDIGKIVLNRSYDSYHLAASGQMITLEELGGPTYQYCIETFDRRGCGMDITVDTLVCFVDIQNKDFTISFVSISISCVFLFLTLVVYIALPELRNLHGKTLICHVAMMLLAYCCLARVQYEMVQDKGICTMLGYGIYFGFVAAFSWLNVMCLDIWWTFGSVRSVQPLRKANAERRRFIWYSVYAWGTSISLTVSMYLLDIYPVASVLDANIGVSMCWFGSVQNTKTDWPHYIFFVMPMGIVTCVNFVLWVLTARHCHRVKSEVHRLQAGSAGDRAKMKFRADRARYLLTGKLWVVMGAGWMWELLATLVSQPRWFWFIFDLINELQGVSIFLILVMKPKLYYLMRKRLGCSRKPIETST